MRRAYAGAVALGFVLTLSGIASADVARSDYSKEGGTHYFKDDRLLSSFSGPSGGNIRVRPLTKRVYLIRPRTSFVPEMFKSVEKM